MADVPVNASDASTVVAVTVNGQVAFDYDFRADKVDDLRATYETESGVETALVGGVDFVASGLGTAAGGTITLVTFNGTIAGDTLTIYRDITIERQTDYTRDLFAADLNAEHDRMFMIMQELERDVTRAVKVPIGEDPISIAPGLPGQAPIYDAGGNLIPADNSGAGGGNMNTAVYDPVGALVAKLTTIVDVREHGALNGAPDNYEAFEAAFAAAAGKVLFIPAGTWNMTSGIPRPRSNTIVIVSPQAIWRQPNYFSYNRPVDPYVKGNVVDWNCCYITPGTENVYFTGGGELRGPFWQADDAGYLANPVQNWPASNGIQVRGHDYEQRKGLALSQTPAKNIRIEGLRFEGWGEDAIQLDQVNNAYCKKNIIKRCGRGGIRLYGVVDGWMDDNDISQLYPGDYLNNGNRMYGITATRCYLGDLSIDRASENIWMRDNTVYDVPFWKCLDTHGGINIRFLNNKCYNSHIGIGIDKGGFTVEDGIAPPRNIWVIGNRFLRTTPDNPLEGDTGVAGAAIFAVAHDQTDTHIGDGLVIDDNIAVGWGEDTRFGALTISNFIGVQMGSKNQLKNSRRSAICLRERAEVNFADGIIIDDVRRSSLGVQDGIAVESAATFGRIGNIDFVNRQADTLRAIFLATPTAGNGFKVDMHHSFRALGAGGITKVANPGNDQGGNWTTGTKIKARINADGSIANQRGIYVLPALTKGATGLYTANLNAGDFTANSTIYPVGSGRGSGAKVNADPTSATAIAISVYNNANALADLGFILEISGY